MWRPLALALLGCPGDPPTDTDPPAFGSLLLDAAPEAGMLLGAWTRAPDDLIVVGGDFSGIGRILHVRPDGVCVEPDPVDGVLWWVHGRSADDWYAVGERGIVLHAVNGERIREDLPTQATLFGVWDDGTDVWAVGGDVRNTQDGEIWRKRAGGDWELALGPIAQGAMFKVWGPWFVGVGRAFRWDGSELVAHPPPNDARLTTARGTSDDHLFAVGGQVRPTLLEWDGSMWVDHLVEPRCSGNQGLNGVWTAPGEPVWIAGHNGAAARWDGSRWDCDELPLTAHHFHAVWKHGDDVFWVGGDFFNPADNRGTILVHPPRAGGPVSPSVCATGGG